MLFEFVKYIMPTWYYQMKSQGNVTYWADVDTLPSYFGKNLDFHSNYKSANGMKYDASYQLFHMGHLDDNSERGLKNIETITDVSDNYLFVRRFFSSSWSVYVLIIRLLSFHNPFVELSAYLKHRKVAPVSPSDTDFSAASFEAFDSLMLKQKPLVSVIIPTLNRYQYLGNLLGDLERQEYDNFEVIICDQSKPINRDFYQQWKLNITLLEQDEPALWLARNRCIKASKGNYIAISDDDMNHQPDWIAQHLKCIEFFDADISAGTFYPIETPPKRREPLGWSSHFSTSNVFLKKEVFVKMGLFDRQFEKQRMGDGEYGMRCYIGGLKNISNSYAGSGDIKAPVGGLREMGSWDSFRPTKFFAPRPVPSVLYHTRKYFGCKNGLLLLAKSAPKMLLPYKHRNNKKMLPLSILAAVVLTPILMLQMTVSWRRASAMLKQGAKIESFNY